MFSARAGSYKTSHKQSSAPIFPMLWFSFDCVFQPQKGQAGSPSTLAFVIAKPESVGAGILQSVREGMEGKKFIT